ncbi:hypothetical protein [Streptomyces endophytica]|uniref:ArsR family transcriptional regulator n=1 Tax=Streptomyces endophytica TaxID=2991496 RepID=A0ABY6PGJ2_9ACTN|nr:hypothetical protein [Streptomyces endophytica]UZJ32896.1 hypothetical protein OJ254_24650 [Streptomyces endophytica]
MTTESATPAAEHTGRSATAPPPARSATSSPRTAAGSSPSSASTPTGCRAAALPTRMFVLDWLRRGTYRRVVRLTDAGREGLTTAFGVPADRLS